MGGSEPPPTRKLLWFTLSARQFRWVEIGVLVLTGLLLVLAFGDRVIVRNVLMNPGFERGLNGWRAHDAYGQVMVTTDAAHSGRQAAAATRRPGYWGGPEQSLLGRLRAGRSYVCSAWVRVRNDDEEPVRMIVRQRDGKSRRHYDVSSTTASSNAWRFLSGRFENNPVEPVEELIFYFEGPARGVDLLVDDVKVVADRFLLLLEPVGVALAVLGAGAVFGVVGKRPRWVSRCGLAATILCVGLLTSWLVDHRSAVVVGPEPDYAKKFQSLGFENTVRGASLEIKEDIGEPTLYQATGVRIYGNCTTNLAIVAKLAEIYGRVQGKVYFRGQRIKIMPKAELAGGLDSSGHVSLYGVIRPSDSDRRSAILLPDQPFTLSFDAAQAAVSPEEIVGPRNRVPWSPGQAAGPPDTFQAGDMRTAWASQDPDGGPEWLRLEYERPVEVAKVRVRETYNPGAIIAIAAVQTNGSEITLWQGVEPKGEAPFESEFSVTNRVAAGTLKITLDTRLVASWNEIDAVELVGRDGSRQWARSATASSYFGQGRPGGLNQGAVLGPRAFQPATISEPTAIAEPDAVSPAEISSPGNRVPWSPGQAAGSPDTPQAGDRSTAWASQDPDGGPEWLRLEYERPVEIAQVLVRETYNPGAITAISAVLTNGSEVTLWQGVEPKGEAPFESEFNVTNRVVAGTIIVRLDTRRVPGWNEIDAVELVGRDGSRQWAKSATASSYFGQERPLGLDPTPDPAAPLQKP